MKRRPPLNPPNPAVKLASGAFASGNSERRMPAGWQAVACSECGGGSSGSRRRPVTLKLVHTIAVALLFSTMAAADVQRQPRDEEMQTYTLAPCLHSVDTGSFEAELKKLSEPGKAKCIVIRFCQLEHPNVSSAGARVHRHVFYNLSDCHQHSSSAFEQSLCSCLVSPTAHVTGPLCFRTFPYTCIAE